MKSSTLQRIKDICAAFNHEVAMKKSVLQITGTHQISITSPGTNLYDLTYHSAPDTSDTIHCNDKHVTYLILEILCRTTICAVAKKEYTLDLSTFLAEEGMALAKKFTAQLTDNPQSALKIVGNRYVLEYHNGRILIADDVFFDKTYPLLMKLDTFKKEQKRFLKRKL
ncbi:hypothetical protein QQ020_20225 [Fulvivirgaceae bacterium BMA12]|uniref:Uncharacterized protein n=1 Tax=Agaribacillus aureus TaxID=3051825 RepID=A0ABT8L9S4_9BACT|nr:hypothetical protein [Fulvivirgaceae bacterium BMA12]